MNKELTVRVLYEPRPRPIIESPRPRRGTVQRCPPPDGTARVLEPGSGDIRGARRWYLQSRGASRVRAPRVAPPRPPPPTRARDSRAELFLPELNTSTTYLQVNRNPLEPIGYPGIWFERQRGVRNGVLRVSPRSVGAEHLILRQAKGGARGAAGEARRRGAHCRDHSRSDFSSRERQARRNNS